MAINEHEIDEYGEIIVQGESGQQDLETSENSVAEKEVLAKHNRGEQVARQLETNPPQNETKGIIGWYRDWRKNRIYKKMDKEIRKLFRELNNEGLEYLPHIYPTSKSDNAKEMAREMHAIETVLEKYGNKLSPEERRYAREAFYERVIAAAVVRHKGEACELGEFARFENAENMFRPSPYQKIFIPNFKNHIAELKAENKYKEANPRENRVLEIELKLLSERAYNLRYNEKYKGYLRKSKDTEKNRYFEKLDKEWIEDAFNKIQNGLKDEFERDPELKKEIDKLREKMEYEALKAKCKRLGIKPPEKNASKQTPKTPDKPKFRVSRTKVGNELRIKRKNKQEPPKVQAEGLKPLKVWENNAKTFAKSEQQKMIDEFRTKYPEQYNRAMGNIEKEQREARKMADELSTLYPVYFDRAMAKNTVVDNSLITNEQQNRQMTLDEWQNNVDIIKKEEHANTRTLYAGKSPFGESSNKRKSAPERC
ncbi:MAG: hypothetical protein GX092_04080 [Clostridia bacterium]|nr:hypothetical protein [Clostridia bacterium]